MTIYVNDGGTWREIEQPYVYDTSTWRLISNQYVNDVSTWRKVFPDIGELWTWGDDAADATSVVDLSQFNLSDRFTPITTIAGGSNWKSISVTKKCSAGIKDDGTLWTWGNGSGYSSRPLGRLYTNFRYLAPNIISPGSTNWADTTTTNAEDLYTVSSGGRMSGAIKTDGTLWMWGPNDVGQLGIPEVSAVPKQTPVTTFLGGTNWKELSCGYQHAAAIKTDGTLWVWGFGNAGRLGVNDTTNRSIPVTTFLGGTDWKQVSCGDRHTLAIKTDGTLWVWGNGNNGQLGIIDRQNLFGNILTPVTTFAGGTNWNHCFASKFHSAAVKTDGTLWLWGHTSISYTGGETNEQGELYRNIGDPLGRSLIISSETRGQFSQRRTPVTTFTGGTNWLDTPTSSPELLSTISMGNRHAAAIKTDGTLWIWGSTHHGALGNGALAASASAQQRAYRKNYGIPTPITTFSGGANWKQVSCGYYNTAAIKTDGTLWVWGNNAYGILGINAPINQIRSTPVTTFAGGTNWKQVSVGDGHTAAIKTDGTLWTWGTSYQGRLGNITTISFLVSAPNTTFVGGTNWRQVSAGANQTAAVKTDGTLWIWGGSIALGHGLGNFTANNRATPITTFVGGTNWKQVSCGSNITAAVKTDGTLWNWGASSYGILGNGYGGFNISLRSIPNTTFIGGINWAQVSRSTAVKTDGTLWTWGPAVAGALGNNTAASFTNGLEGVISTPTTTFAGGTNWTQVQTTMSGSSIALKTDGTIWTWGNNRNGQLAICRNNSGFLFNPEFTDWDASSNIGTPLPNTTSAGGTNWKQVSGGYNHTVAVKTDGTLWNWGLSRDGQLGTNATGYTFIPFTTFVGGTNWTQCSAGPYNTAGIKTDGTLWVWGSHDRHFIAASNGYVSMRTVPFLVTGGGTNWSQVSIGSSSHVTARKTDGTLWTWGNSLGAFRSINRDYLFGEQIRDFRVPNTVNGTNWRQVSLGIRGIGAGVKTDGTLWTWGYDGFTGALGINLTGFFASSTTPVTTFIGGTNWKQVSASQSTTFQMVAAVKTDGTLWTWGSGSVDGELGNAISAETKRSIPNTTFIGGTDWKSVHCANRSIIAIKNDGTLWTWGNNFHRQLGTGDTLSRSTPTTTHIGGTNWKKATMGLYSTSAIKTDGTLWTWGNNSNNGARLGRGNAIPYRVTPVTTFTGGTNWADTPTTNAEDLYTICAGDITTAAIKTDGTLWMWGYDSYGNLGINASISIRVSTPITTFAGGTNWASVDSMGYYTGAIKTDGTLWMWGRSGNAQLGQVKNITDVALARYSTPITTFAGGTNWKQVSLAGNQVAGAVKTDGTLWLWGNGNDFVNITKNGTSLTLTPITTFAGGTNWADTPTTNAEDLYTINMGLTASAAIKTDGTLWVWGNNSNGGIGIPSPNTQSQTPITTFTGGTNWKQISVGYNTFGAIKTDGTLWMWGNGNTAQLGNSQTFGSSKPTPVTTFSGGTNWKQVSCGPTHTGAIKTDGTLWMWGNDTDGRNGNLKTIFGTRTSTPVTTFTGGTNWKQVSCGYNFTAAIKTDGSLWRWGVNAYGGGGVAGFSTLSIPGSLGANLAGGVAWKQISCGYRNSAGVKTDGTLWTWGSIYNGLLGNGGAVSPVGTVRSTPITTFIGGTNWKQVACANRVVAAVKTDGTLWIWGLSALGNNNTTAPFIRSTPTTTFAGGTDWTQVATSNNGKNNLQAVIARKTDGTLWVWGGDTNQSILGADLTNKRAPFYIEGNNWRHLSLAASEGAAIKTDGTLWMWGLNTAGKLGTNDILNRGTPVTTFIGGTDWKQVSVGNDHVAAIKTDGTIWTWGNGDTGLLGNNSAIVRSIPVQPVGGASGNWKQVSCARNTLNRRGHTAAIKTDGTLWLWGTNDYGQLGTKDTTIRYTPVTTFIGGTNWKQVSAGRQHTIALWDNGTDKRVFTFGGGEYVVTSFPFTFSVPTFASTLGISDVTNIFGVVDGSWKTVSSMSDTQSISGGAQVTSAVKTDGTLWSWGTTTYGALGNNTNSTGISPTHQTDPVTTTLGGSNWVSVVVGDQRVVAIKKMGS